MIGEAIYYIARFLSTAALERLLQMFPRESWDKAVPHDA
jgi:hypothetical protein